MKNLSKIKQVLAILATIVLFQPCVYAETTPTLTDVSIFAYSYGATMLKAENRTERDGAFMYEQDGCKITFAGENSTFSLISVEGQGDSFLAYCCAALYYFDSAGNTDENQGRFLTSYLLLQTEIRPLERGATSNGTPYAIERSEDGYLFMVGDM